MNNIKDIINSLNDSLENLHVAFIDGIGDIYAVSEETIKNIIALLKEQQAVKPKCKERMGGFIAGLCPTCGTVLNNVLNVKACGKCGQAVKWE